MGTANGRLKLMKRNSRAQVTIGVRRHAPISRAHLAKVTGLSLTCVCDIVDELLAEGVVVEKGTVTGQRGRPMVLLDINADGAPVAGVWLRPEDMEIAVASPTAEILARRTIPYAPDDDPESVLAAIAQGIQRCAEAARKDAKALRGIGVSLAGLVDIDNLTNRRGWEHVPICRMLEERLGVPAYAENDVRAAALASHWFGGEASDGVAIYVSVAEGIGAALVHDGEILRGVHDTAGLLGHTTIDPNGPVCGCGNRGCLEALASDLAFIRYVWPEVVKSPPEICREERIDLVRKGLDLALSGDASANQALLTVTRYLGIALGNAISILDPRTVFICGTLIDIAPDLVIDLIRREALQHIWPHARGVDIRPLMEHEEFLLQGSIGLVLWQPYRGLQQENFSVRSVANVKPGRGARRAGRNAVPTAAG